jgi:preprotein translocase subunit SecE
MSSIAKPDSPSQGSFWKGLFQAGLYKPTQGKIVRQVTFGAIALLLGLLAYEISNAAWVANLLKGRLSGGHYMVMALLALAGAWFAYRVVNYPKLADFLISVEAEMKKVSWPVGNQIVRASLVVIFVILAMSLLLWGFDIVWTAIFQFFGIRSK